MTGINKSTKQRNTTELPTTLDAEEMILENWSREQIKNSMWIPLLVIVILLCITVGLGVFYFKAFRIYNNAMSPTLQEGHYAITRTASSYQHGDIIAFMYGNKVMIKRVIGLPGDQISMDGDGNVWLNNIPQEENYLANKTYGTCDLVFPYQVPEQKVFVMNDNRLESPDSRNASFGCISMDCILGKLIF